MGIEGLKLLYRKARGVFWLALVFGLLSFGSNFINDEQASNQPDAGRLSPGEALTALFLALLLLAAIAAMIIIVWGVFSYTSAKLAEGKKVTVKEGLQAALQNFWRLTWVGIIMAFRLLGWTLLLFVPGFVMSFRYSLAGVLVFAEPKLRPSEVVSRSAALTKNAWFDTFGTQTLVPLLTLGILSANVQTGVQAKLYNQLKHLKKDGSDKPPTHWLNYATLLLLIVLISTLITVSFAITKQTLENTKGLY